jgi:RNA polymerase sigma-70 factor (ECF subfamily)
MSATEPKPDEPSDAELLRRVTLGVEEAFIELYRRRHDDVFRFAYALARSVSVAQDVTQDVFLNVLENAARYAPAKGTARAWLYGCARHVIVDRLRRESRVTGGPSGDVPVACPGEDDVFRQQQLDRLHAAIIRLPFEYREVLVLCELVELSYAETATVLACPVGTVRSRLHRARGLLAGQLGATETKVPERLSPTEVCS